MYTIHVFHLLFNSLFLWTVGRAVLQSLRFTFFKFYLTGVLGAALVYLLGMLLDRSNLYLFV
ncbi:rhomboid family intramembrane serine protease [Bacteroidetes bacterium endosymbiont of Geopemphigus sp.]|uniref:rhomboid family intramembrane serine protease n=1 Tax=Bacteroidetes bacterium endosymbiont of Geopemphigus sp. TaxID=2047937 RepID=UPI0018A7F300